MLFPSQPVKSSVEIRIPTCSTGIQMGPGCSQNDVLCIRNKWNREQLELGSFGTNRAS